MLISFFDTIPPLLYRTIYYILLIGFCLIIGLSNLHKNSNKLITNSNYFTNTIAVILSIFIVIFIGLRPVSGPAFVDMYLYNFSYINVITDYDPIDFNKEWLWNNFSFFCKEIGLSNREYFLTVAIIYYGLMAVTCWKLMRRNFLLAVLFCFVSFSCFSYGTNGIRNGMACSILMFAISLLADFNWKVLISLLLMLIAISIHRSTMLPAFCSIVAILMIKKPQYALFFWISSIFISLVIGEQVTQFFSSLGFDDRMEQYANLDEMGMSIATAEYKVGFRWDFLIYSMMPIIMFWYVTTIRNFNDKIYNVIAITYTLANAFWVMVIRSNQSNRFAYLSWFLYPIVIAYPLIRMNIWKDQDQKIALILLAYAGFTFFMNFIFTS